MKTKWIGCSITLLLTFLLAIYGKRPEILPAPTPSVTAEAREIVASAIIDSVNDVIHIPTLQQGVIKQIAVVLGQTIKKAQPLFTIDNQFAKNGVKINQIALLQAENSLKIQRKVVMHLQSQLKKLESFDKRAISQVELKEKKHEIKMALLSLTQLEHNYKMSQANLKNAQMTLNQFVVKAPKDGIVLQINGQVNEFIGGGQQVILLGDAQKIMVRVAIDERDVHEFSPQARAYLTHIEYPDLKIPLQFHKLNQYIVVQERLNSRVQEVIYTFERAAFPGFVAGQQFDAHISINKT